MTARSSKMLYKLTLILTTTASASASNLFIETRQASTPSASTNTAIDTASTSEEVDYQKCYYDLLAAALYQPYLSQDGFIKFIQTFSDGQVGLVNEWGGNVTSFSMLQPSLVGIYNLYACGDALIGCPSIQGIDIGVNGVNLQSDGILYRICEDAHAAIWEIIGETTTISTVGVGGTDPTVGGGVNETTVPTVPIIGAGNETMPTAPPVLVGSNETLTVPTFPPISTGSTESLSPTVPNTPTTSVTIPSFSPTTFLKPEEGNTTTSCPPIYVPAAQYQEAAQVINPNDDSGGITVYECKPAPYTPWCAQAAYEPGVAQYWSEAWTLVGECVTNVEDVGGTHSGMTTVPAVEGTDANGTEVGGTGGPSTTVSASAVGPGTTVSGSTDAATSGMENVSDSPTMANLTPVPVPVGGGAEPGVVDPDDPLYTGPLQIKFQFEVGNEIYLSAENIKTGTPENNMMEVLMNSTTKLVEDVVASTFARRLESSSLDFGEWRGLRTGKGGRMLEVRVSTETLVIDDVTDIFCPSSLPGTTLCQSVSCQVELLLDNEPKVSTELNFMNSLYKSIDNGEMTFPENSGVIYSHSPRRVSVVSEVEKKPEDEGGNTEEGDEKNTWVVPVSITCAIIGALLLVLLASLHVTRSKHKREAVMVQQSLDGDDVSGDIKAGYFDAERGDPFMPSRNTRQTKATQQTKDSNPFVSSSSSESDSSSSSSGSGSMAESDVSSSTEDLDDRRQTRNTADTPNIEQYRMPTVVEGSKEDLGTSSGDFATSTNTISSSKSMYRAGIEALLKESCPEEMENLDELMAEYEGREEELIGQLSSMLAAKSSTNTIPSSKSMYRAGIEALLKESCPEEMENLDELMAEYEGREEELIGQLSSMLAAMNRTTEVSTEQAEQTDDEEDYDGRSRGGSKGTAVSGLSSVNSNNNSQNSDYGDGYNQVRSQIEGALGKRDSTTKVDEPKPAKSAAAAAAAATLFTGESQKQLHQPWSSSDDDSDSSSSAGSSDWSTDEGISSVDASLGTDGGSLVNATPSMLAAMGVASAITKQVGVNDTKSLGSDEEGDATRKDLNEAIQAGDWRAVSATAALLAKSYTDGEKMYRGSLSETSVSSGSFGQQSIERASEFAKLVEEGDWEGVMRAAAQYEGASDTSSLRDSKLSLMDEMSGDGTWDEKEASPDLRAEIEALIKEVVPDEMDNIEEMLTQFRGREQDLINTLRTMQEQKNNPTTPPPTDYTPPGIQISATPSSSSVFESDSIKSPWWDDSSKTESSVKSSERSDGSR